MQDLHNEFQNNKLVIDEFDDWPSFHDAEIVSILLSREKGQGLIGPSVTVKLQTADIRLAPSDLRQRLISVALRFSDVHHLVLTGFDYQNAINGLEIKRNSQGLRGAYKVTFVQAQSFECSFVCDIIEVLDVQRG